MRLSTIFKLVVTCGLGLLLTAIPVSAATTTPPLPDSALTSTENTTSGQAIYVQDGSDPEATSVDTSAADTASDTDAETNGLLATIDDIQQRFMLGPLLLLTFLGGLIGLSAMLDRFIRWRDRK